jgi:hypothetical protein
MIGSLRRQVGVTTAALVLVSAATSAGASQASDDAARHDARAVLAWNQLAVQTELAAKQTIQEGVLHLAYVQLAVFDAVDAIDGGFHPFTGHLHTDRPADADAAVAAAAHHVLVSQFPDQAGVLDPAYRSALAAVPAGPAKDRGVRIGLAAAAALLASRSGDGFEASVPYTFGAGPGAWVLPTDNPATVPATPWVGLMEPFSLRRPDQFRPGPPPGLTSSAYAASYQETKAYGAAAGSARTPEQTATALFWGLGRPDAQYNEGTRGIITATRMDRVHAARALALTNLATADAFIACFDGKYAYSSWRPYTAIRAGAGDGNAATDPDPDWTPLVRTPNHPEYPANHSCVTSSYATTIDHLLGRRHFSLTVSGTPGSTQVRHYTSSAQLIAEIADARVWDGVHFRFSTDAGTRIGTAVARYDACHALKPDRH